MAFQSEEQRKAVMAILASGRNPKIRKQSKKWGRVYGTVGGVLGGISGATGGAMAAAMSRSGKAGIIAGALGGAALGAAAGGGASYGVGRVAGSAYGRLGVKYKARHGRERGAGMAAMHGLGALYAPGTAYLYSKLRGPRGSIRSAGLSDRAMGLKKRKSLAKAARAARKGYEAYKNAPKTPNPWKYRNNRPKYSPI